MRGDIPVLAIVTLIISFFICIQSTDEETKLL